jgi:hypothetical protein
MFTEIRSPLTLGLTASFLLLLAISATGHERIHERAKCIRDPGGYSMFAQVRGKVGRDAKLRSFAVLRSKYRKQGRGFNRGCTSAQDMRTDSAFTARATKQ